MIDDPHIDLTDHPPQEARDVISAGLVDFNRRLLGDPQIKPLALLLTSAGGTVVGGMWARTGFQWLFVELLFVPEALRGRGLGRDFSTGPSRKPSDVVASALGSRRSAHEPARSTNEAAMPCSAKSPIIRRATCAPFSAAMGSPNHESG